MIAWLFWWRSVWEWCTCRGWMGQTRGVGRMSGVTRDCSASKCVFNVSSILWGSEVLSLVCGTLMVARLGWSFTLGCSPAVVLRLLWYFFGLFKYKAFFFFTKVDKFYFFALAIMENMALWQRDGMSSSSVGLVCFR